MADGRLQGVQAVIQGQQRVPPKGHDERLFLRGQNGGSGLPRASRQVRRRPALLPLGDGLLIDSMAPRQRPQAFLTRLYCSTDRLCRSGAAVKNLAHSASFHSTEKI